MPKAKKAKKMRGTVVSFLLDESGSMQSLKAETISGFNNYRSQLKAGAKGQVIFNLLKFEGGRIATVHEAKPIADLPPLTDETYSPERGGGTPLIDACMRTIEVTERAVAGLDLAVLVVFQTDGQENASIKHRFADLTKAIKEKQGAGWTFLFLGCGIDAYAQSSAMGISSLQTMAYGATGQHTHATMDSLARNTVAYANSGGWGSLANFSPSQKTAAGDVFDEKTKTKTVFRGADVPEIDPESK